MSIYKGTLIPSEQSGQLSTAVDAAQEPQKKGSVKGSVKNGATMSAVWDAFARRGCRIQPRVSPEKRPINMFSVSVSYPSGLAPFQGASFWGAVPRVETLGFYEADFVKTRRENCFLFIFSSF